jgi:glutathione synthase/RimK-type ligase-like ATP-grasp enzyme
MRSSRAHWEPSESRIAGQSDALLAQEFIYTGAWPVSYRVTTLFGQVLWALKVEASHGRAALEAADGFDRTPGLSIVSNSKGCVMSLCNDESIIRFAEAAHAAFPAIPLLGIDVLRRESDGKLFVVEVNASGWVWHFSSPLGLRAQAEFGFNLESQFDGLRKAARILAAAAQKHAR